MSTKIIKDGTCSTYIIQHTNDHQDDNKMTQMCRTVATKGICCAIKGLLVCISLFIVFLFLLLCTKVDLIGFLERSFGGDHSLPALNISINHTPIVIVDEHNEGNYVLGIVLSSSDTQFISPPLPL